MDNSTCVSSSSSEDELGWDSVAIAGSLVGLSSIVSIVLGLGVAQRLIVAALRCVGQLTLLGYILTPVFSTKDILPVIGIALLLCFLGTVEVAFNKTKLRFEGMFWISLITLVGATMSISILGTSVAMMTVPWWEPRRFIPTVGMLLGNSMPAFAIAIEASLLEFYEKSERIEVYLAHGATRWEAARPVIVQSCRLALLPTINSMAVMGLISIPGMMTGQILAGAVPLNAVKYQIVIMFLLSASTSVGTVVVVLTLCSVVIDSNHRLRLDRITNKRLFIFQKWNAMIDFVFAMLAHIRQRLALFCLQCFCSSPAVSESAQVTTKRMDRLIFNRNNPMQLLQSKVKGNNKNDSTNRRSIANVTNHNIGNVVSDDKNITVDAGMAFSAPSEPKMPHDNSNVQPSSSLAGEEFVSSGAAHVVNTEGNLDAGLPSSNAAASASAADKHTAVDSEDSTDIFNTPGDDDDEEDDDDDDEKASLLAEQIGKNKKSKSKHVGNKDAHR